MGGERTLQPVPFPVNNRSYCIWDTDLVRKTDEFLEDFSSGYFRFLSDSFQEIAPPDSPLGALALRISYHHGLESLFSLLAAYLQAPQAIMAWIGLCSTEVLRSLVAQISSGEARILNPHGLRPVSWERLAALIHTRIKDCKPDQYSRLLTGLTQTWAAMASDFLDPWNTKERNHLIHGLNVRSRGGSLTIARGDKSIELGGDYGTRVLEPVHVGPPNTGRQVHHMMAPRSLLWTPKALAHRLELISISLNNVVAAARVWNGLGSSVRFVWPEDENAFDLSRFEEATLFSLSETVGLDGEDVELPSETDVRKWILEDYGWPDSSQDPR